MDEPLREFIEETEDRLVRAGQHLVALEEGEGDADLVDELFRDFHTIKGNCGFFRFQTLQELAHAAEDLLSLVRSGELQPTTPVVEALFEGVDAMETVVEEIRDTQSEPDRGFDAVIANLEQAKLLADDREDDSSAPESDSGSTGSSPPSENARAAEAPTGPTEEPENGRSEPTEATGGPEEGGADDPENDRSEQTEFGSGSVRVDIESLDGLMSEMTELILARNQLQQHIEDEPVGPELERAYKKLDLVTSDLQETVMATRMRPIGRVWQRYPRMVRDLAREHGKEIELELEGADTELDKNLIERISDPVTHLVRNAADHGLEPPDEREAAGKPREGHIRVRAFQDQGRVNIQVVDDGRGVDPENLGAHAVEQGLVTREELRGMNDDQIRRLLFRPGFSTSDEVTDVSGRGVGLDVVKERVEAAGGSIRIESEPGEGTLVELQLPLTLAVLSALLVETGGQEFVIPQEDIRRLARVEPGSDDEQIDVIHGTPVYRFGDELLPLVGLDQLLELNVSDPLERLDAGTPLNIVVARSQQAAFALAVDDVLDTQDVVVKSLPDLLRNIDIYTGAVVKGDRSVAIILSTAGIARTAGLTTGEQSADLQVESDSDEERDVSEEETRREILWCRSRDDGRIAIPLEMLERLEYIDRSEIHERAGATFVPFGDQLLPLVDVEDQLPERREEPRDKQLHRHLQEREKLPVALYRADSRQVGLVLTEFLEILDASLDDRRGVSRPGVAFCTMIRDEITEVIDIPTILRHSEIEL